MKKSRLLSTIALLLAATFMLTSCQKEATYPSKPIDMTVLFAAGSSADLGIRYLIDLVQKDKGITFVANNREGGGGAVGYQHVLSQPSDGYNAVWNSTSITTTYHQGNLPEGSDYSAFRGVCNVTSEPSAIAVRADAPWQTLDEFLAYAKEHPEEVKLINSGIGSYNHLVATAFEKASGAKFNHVYDAKSSITALLGGQVDAMISMCAEFMPHYQSGSVRVLGVIANERIEAMNDVPLVSEQGVDLEIMMYRGIAVKKDTPDDVVAYLEEAFMKAADSEAFRQYTKDNGIILNIKNAEEFDVMMKDNDEMFAELMDEVGMKKQ